MTRRTNQIDLARAVGVSVSTVSRALSDAPGISDQLRKQIRKLAGEIGYAARGRGSDPTYRTKAYVTLDSATGGLAAFYESLVDGLVAEARAAAMAIDVSLVDERALEFARIEQDLADGIAGVFLVGIDPEPALAARLVQARTAAVLVNGADPALRFDSASPANFFGAAQAASLLLDAGHRSILYVTARPRWTTRQRLRGFQAAVDAVAGARVTVCELAEPTREAAERAIDALLAGTPDWTAVFSMNDLFGIGVLQALDRRGLRVPADMSVLGFDDLPSAAMTSPRLSTFRVDRAEIGRQAIRLMARRIAEPGASMLQVEVAVTGVAGGTVDRPA